jgi:hypothetical protein
MEGVANGFAFAFLLTSLWVLRFRGWQRPGAAIAYFVFFFAIEVVVARELLPPGAFGSGFALLCLALAVPVWVATGLVWRHEQREREGD